MQSGNKPLPKPMVTLIYITIWRHWATMRIWRKLSKSSIVRDKWNRDYFDIMAWLWIFVFVSTWLCELEDCYFPSRNFDLNRIHLSRSCDFYCHMKTIMYQLNGSCGLCACFNKICHKSCLMEIFLFCCISVFFHKTFICIALAKTVQFSHSRLDRKIVFSPTNDAKIGVVNVYVFTYFLYLYRSLSSRRVCIRVCIHIAKVTEICESVWRCMHVPDFKSMLQMKQIFTKAAIPYSGKQEE